MNSVWNPDRKSGCGIVAENNEIQGVDKMAVPKRKTSRMKKRQRKAANRYEGVQANFCTNCSAPAASHRVCPSCGCYNGKQVLNVEA